MLADDYTNINVKVTREQLQKIKEVVQKLNEEKPARKYTQNSICVEAIEAYCDRQLRRAAKKKE
ncbi:MAG: hypothetical protein GXY49_14250 [Syntrophomonadaceae bacterium]|nr:hypothetical protein [Syntrophomonadaceae bacterium]